MRHISKRGFASFVVLLALICSSGSAVAMARPTLTIVNNASEDLLAHLVGPTDNYVPVGASGSRMATLSNGRYTVYFRWGTTRYHYTKLGSAFDASDDYEYTLMLHSVQGNTPEDPSSAAEFNGGR